MRKFLLFFLSLAFATISCDKSEPSHNEPAQEEDVKVTSVKLDKTTATMTVGETLKLSASVFPANAKNKRVSWRSDDEKIGTVSSDGTVTALSTGRVYIYCTTEDGEMTDRCMIDIEAPVVKVAGVSFDVSEIAVNEGDSFPLTPVFKPGDATDKSVTWKSEDTAIATVDDKGVVKAVKVGVTTVSCVTKDGGFVAKCSVKVIQKGNFQIFFGGDVTPSSIDYKLGSANEDVWGFRLYDKGTSSFLGGKEFEITSSETSVAGYSGNDDESGFVKATKEGTVTLTFTYKGNTINSVILNVLPKPDYAVYHSSVIEENELIEGAILRVNPFNKTTNLILFDKSNNSIIKIKKGISGDSSDKKVTTVSLYADGNDFSWLLAGKGAGSSEVTLKYGDFARTITVVATYYVIYYEDKEYKPGMINYKMGSNQNDIIRLKMFDHVTKTFMKGSNLKIVPTDPTMAVVDSYNDTECLVRVKKTGPLILNCFDTSAGVDCYINTVIIAVGN